MDNYGNSINYGDLSQTYRGSDIGSDECWFLFQALSHFNAQEH